MKSSNEILMSLQGLAAKDQIIQKMVQLAFVPFENSITSADLVSTRAQILSQMEQDPYLQGKLDRLAGLLEKLT
jgi:hypothetical protein